MGTRTITQTWTVNGALTDATSAKMSDPTGTYGVKRNDTNAVVTTDGTAMTKTATGTYQHTFTEPAEGLSYTAYVEFVYYGRSFYFEYLINATASDLGITYSTLRSEIGNYLDLSTTVGNWTTQESNWVAWSIRSGLRRFYSEFPWSFLKVNRSISLTADTAEYDLPSDLSSLAGKPTIVGTGKVDILDADELRALQDADPQTGIPRYCAVEAKVPDMTAGTRYRLTTYPTPSAGGTLNYRYVMEPEMIDTTNDHPVGGVLHAETILEACLAAAESIVGHASPAAGNAAQHAAHEHRYQMALARSLRLDTGKITVVQNNKQEPANNGMADQ